ncbi:1-deoxy-D-xylulose-5-phosphate synthase [Fonticella tunisiensis]|uniref:1-deoxy-D-xylulose-5-phosphate synthase n=1 Tax=Fonticella tunisiensis TaxID=1096341 RepID=A0A4R7KSN6_9CLOT|nr:1-deoxy-D-xylulose-5-phosphate synthase [Fonticella tunisiensis]TDT61936.1 1-deoxy-D-xylulose-5-phosphate synthase [Fonticella tunisiensis]
MAILDRINSPRDLKEFSMKELCKLADEIRDFLIENVSKTGGHLASNLGVVELTIALHRIFNMPDDRIIWDVGHQCYVHKILTGRKGNFATLRKYGGMSGFPKPNESVYDSFATGHSSTSISVALGMARARDIKKEKYSVVAVIGDGALTGGMAFEALNDAGNSNTDLIVVLNDNEMSIAQNVGSLSGYLSKIRTEPVYLNLRNDIENLLKRIPAVGNNLYKSAERVKESLKYLLVNGMIFEELGFTYLGPIDGHDIGRVCEVLVGAKKRKGPVLIHVVTKKGKGYCFAEAKPDRFHGIDPFKVETGESLKASNLTYSSAFGEEMIKEGEKNDKLVAITAAMPDGTGLKAFAERFPERFFDVGIAEQHGVTLAAGLAANGLKPVFAVYSTFLQRGYDQVIHDICIGKMPVTLAIDRAGIVGEDGETHQGVFDISYLRPIPNLTILSPKDIKEFRMMLEWIFAFNGPVAIRYPRGGDSEVEFEKYDEISLGKWETLSEGKDLAILAVGKMVQNSYKVVEKLGAKGINARLVNCRFIKPLDTIMLNNIFDEYDIIFTVEDNLVAGGFGSSVLEHASLKNYRGRIVMMGYPDEFITHGSQKILYKKYGLDVDGIMNTILKNI